MLLCSLWFTPSLEAVDGEAVAPVERSAADRAQQLADVALAVYEASGRGIHLPLDQTHPLVAVLRAALGVGVRGDLKVRSTAHEASDFFQATRRENWEQDSLIGIWSHM